MSLKNELQAINAENLEEIVVEYLIKAGSVDTPYEVYRPERVDEEYPTLNEALGHLVVSLEKLEEDPSELVFGAVLMMGLIVEIAELQDLPPAS